MRECSAEVLALELEFSSENTPATARRGDLIRNIISGEFDNGGPQAQKPSCRTGDAWTFTVETCSRPSRHSHQYGSSWELSLQLTQRSVIRTKGRRDRGSLPQAAGDVLC